MKLITTPLLAIVTASVVFGMITVGLQQASAFGFVERQRIGEFQKLTHEFEKGVIAAFEDPENIPEALNAYSLNVQRIFIGDPGIDEVRTLLQGYERDVTNLIDSVPPPDGDKQLVKDFRSLTHDFVKAVIGAVSPPEPE
jgi:hypothetical protein